MKGSKHVYNLLVLLGILSLFSCTSLHSSPDDTQHSISLGHTAANFTVSASQWAQGRVVNVTDYITVYVNYPDMAVDQVGGLYWKGAFTYNPADQGVTP